VLGRYNEYDLYRMLLALDGGVVSPHHTTPFHCNNLRCLYIEKDEDNKDVLNLCTIFVVDVKVV
jgi:hypothetical protein